MKHSAILSLPTIQWDSSGVFITGLIGRDSTNKHADGQMVYSDKLIKAWTSKAGYAYVASSTTVYSLIFDGYHRHECDKELKPFLQRTVAFLKNEIKQISDTIQLWKDRHKASIWAQTLAKRELVTFAPFYEGRDHKIAATFLQRNAETIKGQERCVKAYKANLVMLNNHVHQLQILIHQLK